MRCGVILSTYNQPEWLRKSLQGFACQHALPDEVVIADDGSGDETHEVIDAFRRTAPFSVKHVWQEDEGFRKTRILNRALEASEGDYLIFSDGDCIPRGDFVANHKRLAKPACFLSGGLARLPLHTSRRITDRHIRTGECFRTSWVRKQGGMRTSKLFKLALRGWAASACDRLTHVLPHWSGSNASCWRQHALAVGGFDERMQYWREDFEFGQRLLNMGVRARQVRYSVITLHLEHGRGYVDAAMKARNEAILADTKETGRVFTEYGLQPAA